MARVTVTNKGYSIESLYKWDTGQVLELYGLSLPVVPQVHFVHEGAEKAVVCEATMDASGVIRAAIPDTMLQSTAPLCAYVCTQQGDEFKTHCKIVIYVINRAKPNDYAPDEKPLVYSLAALDVETVTLEPGADAKVEKVLDADGNMTALRFSIPRAPTVEEVQAGVIAATLEEANSAAQSAARGAQTASDAAGAAAQSAAAAAQSAAAAAQSAAAAEKARDEADGVGRYGTGENAEIFNDHANNVAKGQYSHAEGQGTTASGNKAHAEGWSTKATGPQSHAEGNGTTASGGNAHAEGSHTTASGSQAHAEGSFTTASGGNAHTEGSYTVANGENQHVQGRYNIHDSDGKYAHIVGNGEGSDNRSNAHTIDWDGVGWFAGGLKVGGTGQDDPEAKEVIAVPPVTTADNGKVPRVVNGAWQAVDGGITVKKIVFTDRPSLWAWMLENVRKVISAELFQNGMSAGNFKVTPWYTNSDNMTDITFSSVTTHIDNLSVRLSISTVQVTASNSTLDLLRRYELGDTITKASESGIQELPDMYWEYTGVEVVVYYYSE